MTVNSRDLEFILYETLQSEKLCRGVKLTNYGHKFYNGKPRACHFLTYKLPSVLTALNIQASLDKKLPEMPEDAILGV